MGSTNFDPEATEPGEPALVEDSARDRSSWPEEPSAAARVGRFTVLCRVGAGAMGIVYAAYDDVLDRKVAVKLVAPRLAGRVGTRERVLAEAQALAKLRHPHVIQVYEAGIDRDRLFIAMEFVEGKTLEHWFAEVPGGRPWREVLHVFLQAGRGLAAAHAAQLVHCDFKPENAMLGDDGLVRVMDFGLARASHAAPSVEAPPLGSSEATNASDRGGPTGTPAYMAPEQWTCGELDARTDQFSYCVALFEALFGRRPFASDTVAEQAAAVLAGSLREPIDRRDVPERVRRAVLRGLAVDPQQRWASMDELLDVLAFEPVSTRRRWLLAGGAGVLIGGGALAGVLATAPRPCTSVGEALVGAWDAEKRQRVRDGLLAVDAAYAEPTAARVLDGLDAWSGELLEGRRDACEATHVRNEQSEALMLRRVSCLDARQRRFEALVDVFAGADAEILEHAIDAVGELPPPERCADLSYVSSEIAPPDDPAVAAEVAEVEDALAHIEALETAGKYARMLRQAELVWQRVEELDYPPTRIKVLGALASGRYHRGDTDGALEAAREVYVISQAASPLDVAENHRLLGYVFDARGEYASALVEHRKALAILRDTVRPDDPTVVVGRSDLGVVLTHQGRYEEALAEFRGALSDAESFGATAHGPLATIHNNIGATLHALGRTEEALAEFRQALELDLERLGPTHPDMGNYHNNIGALLVAQERHEEALVELRRGQAITSEALGARHPDVITGRHNIAAVLARLGKDEEALAELSTVLSAIEATLGAEHPQAADTLSVISDVHWARGRHEDAFEATVRAHAISSKALGVEHPDSIHLLVKMASYRHGLGDVEGAIRDAEQAVRLDDEHPGTPALRARARTVLANALWQAGQDRSRARQLVEQALELLRGAGAEHEPALGAAEQWLASHVIPDTDPAGAG